MFQMKMKMAIIGCCAVVLPTQATLATESRLGTIKACSAVMTGKCATGAVRKAAYGQQVQLPGGRWVGCAGDCRRKLRESTVDLWQEQMLQN